MEPVLVKYRHVFHGEGRNDFQSTDLVKHRIVTSDAKPILKLLYRVPFFLRREMENQVEDVLEMFLTGTNLEQLSTTIFTCHFETDINALFHLHTPALQHANKINWIALGLIIAGVILTLFILYYFTQSYVWNLMKICISDCDDLTEEIAQKPQAENPSTSHPDPTNTDSEDLNDETPPQVRYTAYLLLSA